jgi:hypothetical protein
MSGSWERPRDVAVPGQGPLSSPRRLGSSSDLDLHIGMNLGPQALGTPLADDWGLLALGEVQPSIEPGGLGLTAGGFQLELEDDAIASSALDPAGLQPTSSSYRASEPQKLVETAPKLREKPAKSSSAGSTKRQAKKQPKKAPEPPTPTEHPSQWEAMASAWSDTAQTAVMSSYDASRKLLLRMVRISMAVRRRLRCRVGLIVALREFFAIASFGVASLVLLVWTLVKEGVELYSTLLSDLSSHWFVAEPLAGAAVALLLLPYSTTLLSWGCDSVLPLVPWADSSFPWLLSEGLDSCHVWAFSLFSSPSTQAYVAAGVSGLVAALNTSSLGGGDVRQPPAAQVGELTSSDEHERSDSSSIEESSPREDPRPSPCLRSALVIVPLILSVGATCVALSPLLNPSKALWRGDPVVVLLCVAVWTAQVSVALGIPSINGAGGSGLRPPRSLARRAKRAVTHALQRKARAFANHVRRGVVRRLEGFDGPPLSDDDPAALIPLALDDSHHSWVLLERKRGSKFRSILVATALLLIHLVLFHTLFVWNGAAGPGLSDGAAGVGWADMRQWSALDAKLRLASSLLPPPSRCVLPKEQLHCLYASEQPWRGATTASSSIQQE